MLLLHLDFSFKCFIGVNLFITLCAFLAYYVDSKRPEDDPKKKNYHPLAILFAPITFPVLFVLSISLFMLRVLVYGVFTILFILILLFIRKPFILEAVRKVAISIGDRLLEANTQLLRLFLSPGTNTGKTS
jgi:hypothetical protein